MNLEKIGISVIIPIYNASQTIVKTLDSVKEQRGNFYFEIILINDGSTDESQNKIEKYQSENRQLNITILQELKNKGVANARNMGLKKATQEYIAFLDADDVWDSYKTEKQMDYFIKNNKIDFLACCRNNESLTFPYQTLPNSKLAIVSLKKLLIKHICATPTVIIKRKTIQEVGWFNKNMRYAEDANYWLRISENHKMYILNESLVTTGEGKNSFGVSGLSANLKEMEKGFEYNLKELYKAKRLNTIEYFLFFMIEKLKYFSRPIRLMLKQNI